MPPARTGATTVELQKKRYCSFRWCVAGGKEEEEKEDKDTVSACEMSVYSQARTDGTASVQKFDTVFLSSFAIHSPTDPLAHTCKHTKTNTTLRHYLEAG
jgi:hypothetical protein